MKTDATSNASLGTLLRGEVAALAAWTADWRMPNVTRDVSVILIGAGAFGAALGCWRSPWQAVFAAIKLPLIMLLTATGNAMLNAMLAPLLGLRLHFRQSFLSILASFALVSAILGAFSPLAAFVIWNSPPLTVDADKWATYSFTYSAILLLLVVMIAFAGVTANLRLLQLLRALAGDTATSWRVLLAWLAGNLFLGSQLSWVLRPFIGNPGMPVQFLRPDAFHGGFFESVFRSTVQLFN
ncbi:MAG: hypothetical protein U1F65_02985 [Verrucomicrobiota bacterium]